MAQEPAEGERSGWIDFHVRAPDREAAKKKAIAELGNKLRRPIVATFKR